MVAQRPLPGRMVAGRNRGRSSRDRAARARSTAVNDPGAAPRNAEMTSKPQAPGSQFRRHAEKDRQTRDRAGLLVLERVLDHLSPAVRIAVEGRTAHRPGQGLREMLAGAAVVVHPVVSLRLGADRSPGRVLLGTSGPSAQHRRAASDPPHHGDEPSQGQEAPEEQQRADQVLRPDEMGKNGQSHCWAHSALAAREQAYIMESRCGRADQA